jgi:hypothetical protein
MQMAKSFDELPENFPGKNKFVTPALWSIEINMFLGWNDGISLFYRFDFYLCHGEFKIRSIGERITNIKYRISNIGCP